MPDTIVTTPQSLALKSAAGGLFAIPFQWADALPKAADAMFENLSGLTTTRASVLGGYNPPIQDLPGSLPFWR